MAELPPPSEAAIADINALLQCGVPLERVLHVRPQGLSEQQIHEIAKDWVASSSSTDAGAQHLTVASAVLLRSKSALQNPGFTAKLLEGLGADPPEELKDPLFYTLMKDPVVLSSGVVVDRSTALDDAGHLRWHSCPFTRQPLKRDVYPLLFLKERLVDFAKQRIEYIFQVVDTALPTGGNDTASADMQTALRAVEVGTSFVKGIGNATYSKELERLYRLKLDILEATGEDDPTPWRSAYGELCSLLLDRDEVDRAAADLAAAAGRFNAKAAARLREAPGAPEGAIVWLRAACGVAAALGARSRKASKAVTLDPRPMVAITQTLLQAARAAEASAGGLPEVSVAQARTAMYIALRRSAATAEETQAFLRQEGITAEAIEKAILRRPLELVVPRKQDTRSLYEWHPLGSLPCGLLEILSLSVSCGWKDQGWGNTKGEIRAVLTRGSEPVCDENLFGTCARNVDYTPVSRVLGRDHPLLAAARAGDVIQFEYMVGGGGGHTLDIRQFVARLQVKEPVQDSNEGGSAPVSAPPHWVGVLLDLEPEPHEAGFIDANGDSILYRLQDGSLTVCVNGRAQECQITSLQWTDGNSIRDDTGATRIVPEFVLEHLRALADSANVDHNIPGEVGGRTFHVAVEDADSSGESPSSGDEDVEGSEHDGVYSPPSSDY